MKKLIFGLLAILTTEGVLHAAPPETKLPLVLVGTIVSGDGKSSQASIKDGKDKLSNVYKQGSKVTGLAEIILITRDVVTIRNLKTNQKEFLRLSPFDSSQKVPKDIFAAGKKEFQVPRSKLNRALNDLPRVLQSAYSEPVSRNGEVVGYQISAIDSDSVFNDLGIKNGDIIKSANDQPVRSMMDAMGLFIKLRDSSSIQIEIERGGKTIKPQYLIR